MVGSANSERFLRAVEAFNRGDVDSMVDLLHADIEWYPSPRAHADGALSYYQGHQGIRDLVNDLERGGIEMEVEFADVEDLGDELIAVGLIRSRDRGGNTSEAPLVYLVEVADGAARRVRAYESEQSARADAGRRRPGSGP